MRSVCAGVKTLGVKTLRMRSVCAHCAGGRPRMRLPLLAPIDETCGASPRLPLGRPRTSPISISLRAHSRSRSRSCSPPPDQLWYNRIPLLPSPVHLTSRRVRSEYSARHLFHPSYIMPGMPPMPSSIPAMPSSFSFTSVIRADVVITDAAIEHELSTACCVTVAGSMTPVSSKFS